MPEEYRRHETFDTAVLNLAEQERIVLHRHDQPSYLTDADAMSWSAIKRELSTSPSPSGCDMTLSKLLVDIPNPFGDGMVRNPWEFDPDRTPDIESIHATAFAACVRLLIQDVRRNGQSSLLIAGPAGSGKTNLVARLLRQTPC